MAGDIIWYVTVLGCALLFVGIGAYARKLEMMGLSLASEDSVSNN